MKEDKWARILSAWKEDLRAMLHGDYIPPNVHLRWRL